MEKIMALAREESSSISSLKRLMALLSTIVVPALFAAVIGFAPQLRGIIGDTVLAIIAIAIVALQLFLSYISTKSMQTVQEAYFEARDQYEQREALSHETIRLLGVVSRSSFHNEFVVSWLAMLREYACNPGNTSDDLREIVAEIMEYVVEARDHLFGFEAHELWNFAVYLYLPNKRELTPIWRAKHHKHPADGFGRIWQPGQGHVGKAFVDGSVKITGDAYDRDINDLMSPPPHLQRPQDSGAYRSFASFPIGSIDEGGPYGVVVATSDYSNRFQLENARVLRNVAAVLACIMRATHIEESDFEEKPESVRGTVS